MSIETKNNALEVYLTYSAQGFEARKIKVIRLRLEEVRISVPIQGMICLLFLLLTIDVIGISGWLSKNY